MKQDSVDMRFKIESLQHTMVDLVEKESEARREITRLVEKLKQSEQEKLEFVSKAEAEQKKTMSKHIQLMDCMEINQRLDCRCKICLCYLFLWFGKIGYSVRVFGGTVAQKP